MSASSGLYFTCAAVRHRRRRARLSQRLARGKRWTYAVSSLGGGGGWCAAAVVVHDLRLADLPRLSSDANKHTDQISVGPQTASLYSLLLTFMFISVSGIGPSVKALITSSVILQKHQLIRGLLPSIGDNCHPRREMQ